jgi:hypothetical protein
MTTREIYFKNLVFCDLPMGRVGYDRKKFLRRTKKWME